MNTNMHDDELKEEYTEGDLKDGVRGKYYAAYQKSHNVVRLNPEVSAAFPLTNQEAITWTYPTRTLREGSF